MDKEPFRLGIQNCKNAINEALKDENIFTSNEAKLVCKLLKIREDLQMQKLQKPSSKGFGKVSVGGKFK